MGYESKILRYITLMPYFKGKLGGEIQTIPCCQNYHTPNIIFITSEVFFITSGVFFISFGVF